VTSSFDRRRHRAVQTPFVFRYDIMMRAYAMAARENFYGSDEAVLVERLGERVKVVAGSRLNIYVATREDLNLARALLRLERDTARADGVAGSGGEDSSCPGREDEKGSP